MTSNQANTRKWFEVKIIAIFLMVVMIAILPGCGGSSSLVGKWFLESTVTHLPLSDKLNKLELFKDGTGIGGDHDGILWKTEGKRFVIMTLDRGSLASIAFDYSVSSSKLTLTIDDGRRMTYVKK